MKLARNIVNKVATIDVPDPLPPAIVRPRQHVTAVLAQSLAETGPDGRAALAWAWTLTGTRPSPVTLSLAPGHPPTREQVITEADADPEGSTAPPGVPTDYCDQLGEARRILSWLVGTSDDIPLDDDQRGRFIGCRDDYARTDAEIRQVRDQAVRSLAEFDLPDHIAPGPSSQALAVAASLGGRRLATRRPRPARLGPRRPPRRPAHPSRCRPAPRARPHLRRSCRQRRGRSRPSRRRSSQASRVAAASVRRGHPSHNRLAPRGDDLTASHAPRGQSILDLGVWLAWVAASEASQQPRKDCVDEHRRVPRSQWQ